MQSLKQNTQHTVSWQDRIILKLKSPDGSSHNILTQHCVKILPHNVWFVWARWAESAINQRSAGGGGAAGISRYLIFLSHHRRNSSLPPCFTARCDIARISTLNRMTQFNFPVCRSDCSQYLFRSHLANSQFGYLSWVIFTPRYSRPRSAGSRQPSHASRTQTSVAWWGYTCAGALCYMAPASDDTPTHLPGSWYPSMCMYRH